MRVLMMICAFFVSTSIWAQDDQLLQQNQQKSAAFLAANQKKPNIVTLKSGLQYKIIKPGNGPSPSLTDQVVVAYEGKTIDGKVFDSTKPDKPVSFAVSSVIEGWQQALVRMKPGAKWEVYVPANLAYGQSGVPGVIAPGEALIFSIHLIKVDRSTSQPN